jgi:hypothetical protein
MATSKLSPLSLGLSLGILWGVSVLLLGLIATYYPYGKPFVAALATLYPGYAATISGSFIGGAIGLVDGFISGLILALLYNLFACCCRKHDQID